MKKVIALVLALVCVLGMVGCNNRSMNYIISNEPSITGIVKETNENAILIENDDGEYWVSLNVENKDSVTNFNIGDEVVVYYDGNIAESYPMQINTVYAITLKTPADRAEKTKTNKFQFIERIRYTTFAYFYLNSAPFGYSLAEKNPHLSTTSVGSFQLNPSYRTG